MVRTCLVVDDSRVVRKVARRILEAHGFTVAEAGDGQQALDACHTRDAGLRAARLEHAGDERAGIPQAAARRVRAGQAAGGVLHDRERDVVRSRWRSRNGAQEYIMKPFDEEILVGKFDQVGLL